MGTRARNLALLAAGVAVALAAAVAVVVLRAARRPVHFPASAHCPEGTVYVPGARFTMGGPLERERPQREATVAAFNAWGGEHHNPSFEPMPVAYEESDGWKQTAPVGSFPGGASPSGALDMAGNVREWTTGRFDLHDPPPGLHLATPTEYATRGGSLSEYRPEMLHAAARFGQDEASRDAEDVGFRCAFDAR